MSFENKIVPVIGISIGLTFILYSILPHGIGLSQDSISYLSAARSLHDSGRILDIDGTPFVAWAPLYPLLIALLGILPFRIESSLAGFDVLVYIFTIITSWILILRSLEKSFFRIVCLAAIIFSFTLLQVYATALSEALFLLLINLVMLICGRNWREWGTKDFVLLGLIVSLAMLQRYAGIFLALLFLMTLLSDRNSKPKTVNRKHLLLFLAFLPIALWLLRNWLVADTITGFRTYSIDRLWNNTIVFANTLTSWILPIKIPIAIRIALLVPISYVLWLGRNKGNRVHLFTLISYLSVLLCCYLVFSFEEPGHRLLSPIFTSFFILLFSGLDGIISDKSKKSTLVFSVLVGIWMIYPVTRALKHIQIWHNEGVETYNNASWQHSQLINWLKENEITGKIFSNDASAIYYFTGKRAFRVPKNIYGFNFENLVENGNHLVWWKNRDLNDLQTIRKKHILEETARLNDGAVFVIHK